MLYFAYGSNMSSIRLKQRVPSAEKLGVFSLKSHLLRFHKVSQDGSGKCDAYHTKNSSNEVIGVLFKIEPSEKHILDLAEGLGFGYQEKIINVVNGRGETNEAFTYYALQINSSMQPYTWYLNHVVKGAIENALPHDYLELIHSTECIDDPDINRDAQQRAMYT